MRELDAGGGERVPTLYEVLDRFGERIPFNLELKRGSRATYEGLERAALDAVRERVRPYTPERVAPRCGVGAETIRGLARELADADAALLERMAPGAYRFTAIRKAKALRPLSGGAGTAPEVLDGAEVAVGGDADASDHYLAPTLVPNVKADSPLMRDEIFGPILPILEVGDLDEAIAFVAEREKPLALYLFTGSEESEAKVVAETSSGGVCVNATVYHLANPELPFGGVGASGMGTYHGRASFEAFSHRKSVMRKSTRIDPKLAYPPYSRLLTRLLRRRL